MANAEILHISRKVWIQQQASFQVAKTVPVAADAVKFRVFEVLMDPGFAQESADHTGNIGGDGTIIGPKKCTWKATGHLIPPGAAQAPDVDVILKTGIFSETTTTPTATTVSGSGSTPAVIDVADASGISVGDIVGLEITTNGYTKVRGRLVTAVDTVSTPDNITVSPALPSAPAENSDVHSSTTYKTATTNEETAFTAWVSETHNMDLGFGCFMDTLTLQSPGAFSDKAPTIEASGPCRGKGQFAATTLDGAINDTVAELELDAYQATSAGLIFTIEAEGANTAEEVLVTSKDTSTPRFNVTRSATAAVASSHANGAACVPYDAGRTMAGDPIPPRKLYFDIGLTATTLFTMNTGTLKTSIGQGLQTHEREAGDEWAVYGYSRAKNLAASVEATGLLRAADLDFWQRSGADADGGPPETFPVAAQYGDQANKAVVVIFDKAYFEQPNRPNDGDGTIGCTIKGHARAVTDQAYGPVTLAFLR